MYAISMGKKVKWNGDRWNPCYVPHGNLAVKWLNGKAVAIHLNDTYIGDHKTWVADY